MLSSWKWKLFRFVGETRRPRSRCVVCLQVHKMESLPSLMEGRVVVVGWKTKGWKGEQTLPVHAFQGMASFDEIFLHYCNNNVRSVLKSFTIWVSLVDAADCNLGTFHVDLSQDSTSEFGGKMMSLELEGAACGGSLSLSVYCRMLEEEEVEADGCDQSRAKCFSCLPDLNCLRSRPETTSARRVTSLRSDPGFITIENSGETHEDSTVGEDKGFITMEEETFRARSRRPPSDDIMNTDDESGDERPCFLMDITEDFDVEKVEDEFLRMLEERYWKRSKEQVKLSVDLDLESLIKEAEMELMKAAQVWKSRDGAAEMEKEEHEELMKRWGSCGRLGAWGFGSPVRENALR